MASLSHWFGLSWPQQFEGCKIWSQSSNEQFQPEATAFSHGAAKGQGNLAGRTGMEAPLCPGLAAQLHCALPGWWVPPSLSGRVC